MYFESIEGRVAESTKAYPQTSAVSPADIAALQCYQAFELPPRSTKACYIDNFFKYCYPWLPVVEPAWLRETPTRKPSILLLQTVLLAGSRVATPSNLDASHELYASTKALFFSNYEQNPVIRIITCPLMRWWNPAGPDRVCMDSSHVWISTGVSLAVAIGLYADSPQSRDTCYRRRLWSTLMVSDPPTLLFIRTWLIAYDRPTRTRFPLYTAGLRLFRWRIATFRCLQPVISRENRRAKLHHPSLTYPSIEYVQTLTRATGGNR